MSAFTRVFDALWRPSKDAGPGAAAVALRGSARCAEAPQGDGKAVMVKRAKAEKWAARGERLAAALRENLKRRKAQARGRAAGEEAPPKQAGAPAKPPDFRRNRGTE